MWNTTGTTHTTLSEMKMPRYSIPTDVVESMRELIAPLDTFQRREKYRNGLFPRADAVNNLNTRYRYDLMYQSGAYKLLPVNARNVDTALRRIIPDL